MFLTLRRCLVVFLTILQLFTPWVHAHTGEQFLKSGLHIPGLERFETKDDKLIVQLKGLQLNHALEGMIVAIDMGVKQHQINPLDNNDGNSFIHQSLITLNAQILRFDVNVSQQKSQFVDTVLIQENSPRAPPLQ